MSRTATFLVDTPTVSLALRHTICDVSGERLQPGGVRAVARDAEYLVICGPTRLYIFWQTSIRMEQLADLYTFVLSSWIPTEHRIRQHGRRQCSTQRNLKPETYCLPHGHPSSASSSPGSSGCGSSLLTKLLLPKRCLLSLLVIIIVSAVIVPCTSSFLAEVAK